GRLTLSLIGPAPTGVQVPPPVTPHVHVTAVRLAGGVSVTMAPLTGEGPAALDATIAYVMGCDGAAVVCPSVFVIARSAVERGKDTRPLLVRTAGPEVTE